VKAMLKNVPKSWSNDRCLRFLDVFKQKKTKRACVKEASDPMRPKHKGGLVPWGMLICTVVAHDDDPGFEELKPVLFVAFGKGSPGGVTLYAGCTVQVCGICNQAGHLAEVHDKWANRTKGLKRKAATGLIRRAKQRVVGLPESELMKPVVDDSNIQFVEDRGLRKEAWRCTLCLTRNGKVVCGESFSQALKHVTSEQHQKAPAEGNPSHKLFPCLV
jgi:hypothetical protein